MVPDDLNYTKDHEWVRVDGGEAVIGITDHAQKELGDIVFLELPEPGRTLAAAEEMGSVESVKAVSEIYAPVSVEVLEANRALTEDPDSSAIVNQDPYGKGWLVRLKLSEPDQLKELMSAEAYRSYIESAAD
jgi:glycine cleavage system H protein